MKLSVAAPFVAGLLCIVPGLHADLLRVQTFTLRAGWNAIYLAVEPADASPTNVFSGAPVDIAAAYLAWNTPVQFIKNPSAIGWKNDGWGVWYGPSREDSFLSTLFAIHGNRAYLVHATAAATFAVRGTPVLEAPRWQPDGFNFVGFSLNAQAPPTFQRFFAASPAHQSARIYRLAGDAWSLVTNPSATLMQDGEAFWIECKGTSDYPGPLEVRLAAQRNITFTVGSEAQVSVINRSPDPARIQVETLANESELALAQRVRGVTTGRMDEITLDLPSLYTLPVLEPGQGTGMRLQVRRERMTQLTQSALLKFSSDLGVEVWVPVVAQRQNLSE